MSLHRQNSEFCIDPSRPYKEVPQEHPPGLYSQSGSLILESPPTENIAHFSTIDPRITYFHFRNVTHIPSPIPDETPITRYVITNEPYSTLPSSDRQLESYRIMNSFGISNNVANERSVRPLQQYLAEKYQDRIISVRGTACTLSRQPITIGGRLITNPAQIAQLGAERAVDFSPQIGFDPSSEIPDRSVQWLFQHPQELRELAVREGKIAEARSIYPILIIYDRSKFDTSTTTLPADPEQRHLAILEIIILDYPLSEKEYQEETESHTSPKQ